LHRPRDRWAQSREKGGQQIAKVYLASVARCPSSSCQLYRFGASSDDYGQLKRHRGQMVVQWQAKIGARICDVVARKDTDRVYVATDDSVTVMAGSEIAARIPVGPDTKRLILGVDEAYLYVPGYDGSVRIIGTADHSVTTSYGTPSTAEVVSPAGRHLYTAHTKTPHQSVDTLISVTAADGRRWPPWRSKTTPQEWI
jgi:DNA-binding beta-propeller fold protein YncE